MIEKGRRLPVREQRLERWRAATNDGFHLEPSISNKCLMSYSKLKRRLCFESLILTALKENKNEEGDTLSALRTLILPFRSFTHPSLILPPSVLLKQTGKDREIFFLKARLNPLWYNSPKFPKKNRPTQKKTNPQNSQNLHNFRNQQ